MLEALPSASTLSVHSARVALSPSRVAVKVRWTTWLAASVGGLKVTVPVPSPLSLKEPQSGRPLTVPAGLPAASREVPFQVSVCPAVTPCAQGGSPALGGGGTTKKGLG